MDQPLSQTTFRARLEVIEAEKELAEAQAKLEMARLKYKLQTKQHEADHDPLTKLTNRLGFQRLVDEREGWYVMCDLNNFKVAQDSHPLQHEHGDRILREFARFLTGIVREESVVCRWGGDEFVVFTESEEGAKRIKHMIRMWTSFCGAVTCASGMGRDFASADANCRANKDERKSA